MKTIDLHAHTTASDGSCTPTQLVELAARKGLAAVAVTDHDTTAGLAEALAAGERLGVRVVPGLETSTHVEDQDAHIVSLFIDPDHPAIREMIAWMAQSRQERNRQMVARLQEAGLPVTWEELLAFTGGDPAKVGRAHVGRLLMAKGLARTMGEAFQNYLMRGRCGYVSRQTPSPAQCIQATHRAGGLAFVAHIHQICRRDPQRSLYLCRKTLADGPDGLETLYSEYDDFWRGQAEALVQEYGLLRSGGSDFHGTVKPGLELGTGYGDLAVPLAYLEAMDAARGR